mgnify:CR=1 FL=1
MPQNPLANFLKIYFKKKEVFEKKLGEKKKKKVKKKV